MCNQLKYRWYLAYSRLRFVKRQYLNTLAAACARGEIKLDTYARHKSLRQDETTYFINSALKMKGIYAVIFMEHIVVQWQKLDEHYGIP